MTKPIVSPDGYWLWNGVEWIPNPSKSVQNPAQQMHDSVSNPHNNQTVVQDSAITGGINHVTNIHNNPIEIANAIASFVKESEPVSRLSQSAITPQDEVEMNNFIENINKHSIGMDLDVNERYGLLIEGKEERNVEKVNLAYRIFLKRTLGRWDEFVDNLNNSAYWHKKYGDLEQAKMEYFLAGRFARKHRYGLGELISAAGLGEIYHYKEFNLIEARRHYYICLDVALEIDDPDAPPGMYDELAEIAGKLGDFKEKKDLISQREKWIKENP